MFQCLGLLVCKMGIIVAPASQGQGEGEMGAGVVLGQCAARGEHTVRVSGQF